MGRTAGAAVVPYVPRLTLEWLAETPEHRSRQIPGTLVFADVSGFTALSERLARHGREGAEQLTEIIDRTFDALLASAYDEGGRLLTFGGDALLLLFEGDDHPVRAVRAAGRIRRAVRSAGRQTTGGVPVVLRISIGVHSGSFAGCLVGSSHRQLLMVGSEVSRVVSAEHAASAGEILVSPATAALLPGRLTSPKADGWLRLARTPAGNAAFPITAPPPGADRVATWAVPRVVVDHVGSGLALSEHRMVTVGFVQLRGVDRAVADDLVAATADLETVVNVVQQACEATGITFLAADIDEDAVKIILVAGSPSSAGDDEESMLRTLRQVFDQDLPLRVRAGVHRGNVYVGDVGPPHRRTFTVMGDTVNLAARLMANAPDGVILATHEVVDRSRTAFEVQEVEPFRAKGKRDVVHAVQVGPAVRAASAVAGAPLFGREVELAALRAAWAAASDGRGRGVQLVGEPGIGKTRLLHEMVSGLAASEGTVLAARGDLYGSVSPYRVARSLLLQAMGLDEHQASDDEVLAATRSLIARDPDLAEGGALLADVLGIAIESSVAIDSLAEEHRRSRLHDVATRLFDLAVPGAVTLLVEDAHWADDASSALLTHLTKAAASRPWLVVTTRRGVDGGYQLDPGEGTQLRLEPLDDVATARLVEHELGGEPLPPAVMAGLSRKAGGNPLFLRELVLAIRDAVDAESLPDTLDVLLNARLDRLGPRDRDFVRRAAVLGQRFPVEHLALVVREGATVPGPSAWARLAEFIGAVGDGEVAFTHALLRDSAYRRLPFGLRRSLHGAVADSLLAGGATSASVLSFHFTAARRWPESWACSVAAGRQALAAYAPVEAAELLERALQAARQLGTGVSERDRVDVALELAKAHERSGSFADAERAYARASGGDDDVLAARVLVQRAWLAERQGRLRLGVRRARAARRRLEAADTEVGSWVAQALTVEGTCLEVGGHHGRAAAALGRAVDLARESGDRRTQAHAGSIVDWSLAMSGRIDEATNLPTSLQIYRDLGDLGGQATCLTNLGALAYLRGDWPEAVSFYQEGRAVQLRSGDVTSAALGAANTGEVLSDQGHWDAAASLVEDALQVWRSTGHRHGVAWALGLRGRLLARSGSAAQADSVLQEALELHREVGADGDAAQTTLWLAEHHVLAGDGRAALAVLDGGGDDASVLAQRVRACGELLVGSREVFGALAASAYRRAVQDDPFEQVVLADVLNVVEGRTDVLVDAAPVRERLGVVRTSALPQDYL